MSTRELLALAVVLGLGFAMLFLLARLDYSGPSCEERGGTTQFTHFLHIYQPATKTTILMPQYSCVGAKP